MSLRGCVLALCLLYVSVSALSWVDTHRHVSFEYPDDWKLTVHARENTTGWFLQMKNPDETEEIEFGHYLMHIPANCSLSTFVDNYRDMPLNWADVVLQTEDLEVDGHEAHLLVAQHPDGTHSTSAHIKRGKVVYFVWSNIAPDNELSFTKILRPFIDSLKFDETSPSHLHDIHGTEFGEVKELHAPLFDKSLVQPDAHVLNTRGLDGNWWSPLRGYSGVCCGSSYHTGNAYYAADLQGWRWRDVYAVNSGDVSWWGPQGGYGNLVMLWHGSFYSAYAHLEAFSGSGSGNKQRGTRVAFMGDSGNGPVHLHYHVRHAQTNAAINIAGSYTWWNGGDWPFGNCWCPCFCASFNQG